MSKFTPGPWEHTGQGDIVGKEDNGYGLGYVDVCSVYLRTVRGRTNANARLIAAAPDLLEACQTFAEWLRRESAGSTNEPWAGKRDTPEGEAAWREWYDENLRICDLAQEQVRAAIAKATGETP